MSKTAARVAASVVVAGTLTTVFAGACGGASPAGDANPVDDAAIRAEASRPREASDVDVPDSAVDASAVPPGWVPYNDYDPGCGFFIPSSTEYLPPPMQWETCAAYAASIGNIGVPGPPGMVCRHMTTPWADPNAIDQMITFDTYVNPTGRVSFMQRRFVGETLYDLVLEADGPVHQAILQVGKCLLGQSSLYGDREVCGVLDNAADANDNSGGAIGGDVGKLAPEVIFPKGYTKNQRSAAVYELGADLVLQSSGGLSIRNAITFAPVGGISNSTDDFDVVYADFKFWNNDLFWIGDSSQRTVIKSWTAIGGNKTLIGHGTDPTRGVNGFGTDGVDMVWTEASGRPDLTKKIYSTYETWTAKYSTDPDVVSNTKRRLRSEPGARYSISKEVVGCGYSAHEMSVPNAPFYTNGIRVVRLSDGISWEILPHTLPQKNGFNMESPLALTCDELFVRVYRGSSDQLVAVRLDSLGTPVSPD